MTEEEQIKIMNATIKPVLELLEKRLNNRLNALEAIAGSPLDNVPEIVQKMREDESQKIRAVIQEQRDLIEMIKVIYPNA